MPKAIVFDTNGNAEMRVMSGLTDYQQAVGGLLERIRLKERLGFYVHDNGRTLDLPLNQRVSAMVGFPIFGPAVMTVTGIDGQEQDVPQRMIDEETNANKNEDKSDVKLWGCSEGREWQEEVALVAALRTNHAKENTASENKNRPQATTGEEDTNGTPVGGTRKCQKQLRRPQN